MSSLRTASALWLAISGLAVGQDPIKRGYLGVNTVPAAGGELVVSVDPQGPAGASGIRVGDFILRLDAQPLTALNPLSVQMRAKKAAQTATLSIRDASGVILEKAVTLRERRAPVANPLLPQSNYRLLDDDDADRLVANGYADYVAQAQFMQQGPRPTLGVTVLNIDPGLREQMKLARSPESSLARFLREPRPRTPSCKSTTSYWRSTISRSPPPPIFSVWWPPSRRTPSSN